VVNSTSFSSATSRVQTTERYRDCNQRIHNAVNDTIGIEPKHRAD
jgi:hypothetical protein